ncbi:hypothetical protein D3C84_482140 [compost metagenome]
MDKEAILLESNDDAVIDQNPVLVGHQRIARTSNLQALDVIDVHAVQEHAGIRTKYLDLAEGGAIENPYRFSDSVHLTQGRIELALIASRIVFRPFPAVISEMGSSLHMPCMSR